MRISGYWLLCDDGVRRPVLGVRMWTRAGQPHECTFLIDTWADNTVLPVDLVNELGFRTRPSLRQLSGVGGIVTSTEVFAQLEFLKDDGEWITISVECFALPDAGATDMPILGRDILSLFSLIVDGPGDRVCLLHGSHRYAIQES